MSITLTYWEDPPNKKDPEDFDEIRTVVLKTVKHIPMLVAQRPLHCTMISTEHSAPRKLKNGRETKFFKEVWRGPAYSLRKTLCPMCHGRGRV